MTEFTRLLAIELVGVIFVIVTAAILVRSGAIGMALLEAFQ